MPSPPLPAGRSGISLATASAVGVAAAAMVATLPGRTQGLGLVTEPLLRDLNLSRVGYAAINLWATLLGALFCLPCGRLMDRLGPRVVLSAVVAALEATVVAMSAVKSITALFIAVTLFLPKGVVGLWDQIKARRAQPA